MNNHSERSHAILSPSSAKMWLNCPPSARLAEELGSKDSTYAEEGTFAHEMAEYALSQYLDGRYDILDELPIAEGTESNKYFSREMVRYVSEYVDFVISEHYEMQKAGSHAGMLLESKVDISKYVPECFGSVDVQLISPTEIHIIDLKYGTGVKVYANDNPQIMLYALGCYESLTPESQKKIKTVKMTIGQCRLAHYDSVEMPINDLLDWGKGEVMEKAKTAFAGKGELNCGDWCKFCPARAICRKQFESITSDFEVYNDPKLMTDAEIIGMIGKIDEYKSWLEALNRYVYDKALAGKKWEGYKLIEGRTTRKFTDTKAVETELYSLMYKPEEILKPSELKSLTELEKMIGKRKFADTLGQFITTSAGLPKLVPESAKGKEFSALSDFDVE